MVAPHLAQTNQYDVIIIGASLAGCTAAIFFARQGLQVVLIERENSPKAYKKICTHYIQSSATPTIQRLGLDKSIEKAGGIRNSIDIWTRWGWIFDSPELCEAQGYPSYGYSLQREKLDPLLRSQALSTPGVKVILGATLQGLLENSSRITGVVVETSKKHRQEIHAQLIVGADGRHSSTAKLAKIQLKVKTNQRFAYYAYYKNLKLSSGQRSQWWFLDPEIGYAFTNNNDLTLLAAAVTKEHLPQWKKDPEQHFNRFFQQLPDKPDLRQAKRVSPFLGIFDADNLSRKPTKPGLALIGDAATSGDPLWGIGCGWAFQSAEWLVECTADALKSQKARLVDRALRMYKKKHQSFINRHLWLIADYSTGRKFNFLEKLLYSAAAQDPTLANHLHLLGSRNITALQFLSPRMLLRAATINLKSIFRKAIA